MSSEDAPKPPPQPQPRAHASDDGVGESFVAGGAKFVLSPSGTSAIPLGMPREIGPYQIQRLLGSGGMATVYAALQKQPRRTVALKVMKAGIAHSRAEAALRRFKREIEILGKLHHPFIAAVYDAGTFDDGSGQAPYFVMEYIPGALNILEYIARKELDLRERLKLFVKVCAAVEHGHSHKVIHRDLKPGNILIDQYGDPKIIDFGIAHAAEVDSSQQTMTTEAGNLVGTLQYMAPEQVDTRPQDLDGRCDVYALGVLLYKMTTGKPPYDLEALPVFEAIRIIREEQPRKPSEINSDVKGDLETIILKAMERDRGRRYRNAGSLGRDIVRYLAQKPINARRASIAYRFSLFVKRNSTSLAVAGVIAIVALTAVAYTTWERQRLKREQERLDLERQSIAQQPPASDTPAITNTAPPTVALQQPFSLRQHTAKITGLRLLETGESSAPALLSASLDHQLLRWNLQTRQTESSTTPLGAMIGLFASSDDGTLAAVVRDRGEPPLEIIRTSDGRSVRSIRDTGGAITSLAMSASGDRIAWGADNLTLHSRATDPDGMKPLGADDPLRQPRTARSVSGALTAMAFTPDARVLAAGTASGAVMIWNPLDDRPPVRLIGLRAAVVALSFQEHEGARALHAVAEDGSACTWIAEGHATNAQWSAAITWQAAPKPAVAMAFSSNGAHLAIATADTVHIWHVSGTARRPSAPQTLEEPPTAIAIDHHARWFAAGMMNGDIVIHPLPAR